MKILYFTGLYLGLEIHGHTEPETRLSTRLLDFLKALEHPVDYLLSKIMSTSRMRIIKLVPYFNQKTPK